MQVAHVTEGVKFVEADAHGRVPHGWAEAQVLASADFAHGSWLWTHFSGGLNYQARTFAQWTLFSCHTCNASPARPPPN